MSAIDLVFNLALNYYTLPLFDSYLYHAAPDPFVLQLHI